jgi:hypothetical protein
MLTHSKTCKACALLLALIMVTGIFMFSSTENSYAAAASSFTISGQTTPSVLKKGERFTIKGTIRSRYKLNAVKVGVVNGNGSWVKKATYTGNPKATSFDILKKADERILFGKLSPGTYTYKVWARDIKGKSKYLVSRQFTVAQTPSFTISGQTFPTSLKPGKSFTIKGVVKSANKITQVKVGVCNSKGAWVKTAYYSRSNLNAKSFNILSAADAAVKFSKLSAGNYSYRVWVKDITGSSKYVLNKGFKVSKNTVATSSASSSRFTISGQKYPVSMTEGTRFTIKGTVKSAVKMNYVKVGVVNSKGAWVSGATYSCNPKAKSFDILKKADESIKFGKLKVGTYYYKVWARDVNGRSAYVLNKKFTVKSVKVNTATVVTTSVGKRLKYSSSVINAIGRQPYSGPCGIYSMAYCRAILDGKFTKGGYSSIHSRIINQYGLGGNCAYWNRAGGNSVYYSTQSSCYKAAYRQINKGRPCIISLRNTASGNNHYVCVIGYLKGTTEYNVAFNKFIILDPGNGKLRYMKDCSSYRSYSTPQLITF